MIFDSKEQQKRVEGILDRLEILEVETVERTSYETCKVVKEEELIEALNQDADDVVTLVAMYLYSLRENASCVHMFRYTLENGQKVEFRVSKERASAVFTLFKEK